MCGPSMCVRHSAFAAAVSFFVLLLSSAHATTPHTLVATVERLADGDTLVALTSEGIKFRIRLTEIDAPGSPELGFRRFGAFAGAPAGRRRPVGSGSPKSKFRSPRPPEPGAS